MTGVSDGVPCGVRTRVLRVQYEYEYDTKYEYDYYGPLLIVTLGKSENVSEIGNGPLLVLFWASACYCCWIRR